MGCCMVPEGIVSGTAITTTLPSSTQHDASHLGLGGPLPLLAACGRYPPPRRGRQGLVFGGENIQNSSEIKQHIKINSQGFTFLM
jgi:hypothetical protein